MFYLFLILGAFALIILSIRLLPRLHLGSCKECHNALLNRRVKVKKGNVDGYLSEYKCNKCGNVTYHLVFSTGEEPVNNRWAEIFMDYHI
jgi:hypothetical protein